MGGIHRRMLEAAEKADQARAGKRGDYKVFEGDGRLHMQVSLAAVMNAVNTEGPEVLSADADGYWEDQKRIYPWTNTMPDKCAPKRRRRTRFGIASYVKVYK